MANHLWYPTILLCLDVCQNLIEDICIFHFYALSDKYLVFRVNLSENFRVGQSEKILYYMRKNV